MSAPPPNTAARLRPAAWLVNGISSDRRPFILRGVTLAGIDSVMCPRDRRLEVWRRLGRDLDMDKLNLMTTRIGLAETLDYANQLLSGTLRGRTVVAVTR